jgi:putative OPT family oligopeptide transporter
MTKKALKTKPAFDSDLSEDNRFKSEFVPYIESHKTLPEITLKATLLGIILAVVMAGSNAYLGLKAGLTVSASIPAAVISMAILRFFRNSNILENNIVQTAASAGEVVAAAVVFTLPALLMMRYWTHFPFFLTTAVVMIGGLLGVLFSIPLRRAFIVESPLKFPEGIAAGEVLKAGDQASKGGAKDLMAGGIISALVKFAQSGLMIFEESAHYWVSTTKTVVGMGTGLSLVLMGAGYIVGVEVGVSMLLGNLGSWLLGVPLYGYFFGLPEADSAYKAAVGIWNSKLRMVGVGAMVVGGVWTLVHLFKPIKEGIASSFDSLRHLKLNPENKIKRTDYDIPMTHVILGILVLTIPLFFIFDYILKSADMGLSSTLYWGIVGLVTVFALIVGFICAAIGAYMAGLVGSSNTPISGVSIMAILSVSLILLLLLGSQVDFVGDTAKALAAAAISIIIGAVMANSASISSDNLQDLKAGQIVGSTPWKQQLMLMMGVVVGALVITPILEILYQAYGIGNVLPREGMDPAQALSAPKAAIMAAVAQGVFSRSLDWSLVLLGCGIAVVIIILDEILKSKKIRWRFPVLSVALGIYMPLDVVMPLAIGGFIAFFADKALDKQRSNLGTAYAKAETKARHRGLLFSSGLIAGEALLGILLAIPFAAYQSTTLFKIKPEGFENASIFLGMLAFFGIAYYLYKIASRAKA